MEIVCQSQLCVAPEACNDGSDMLVPALTGEGLLLLGYPARGKRLFAQSNIKLAASYIDLGRKILYEVREKLMATQHERRHIMDDLHDEFGGTLLELS